MCTGASGNVFSKRGNPPGESRDSATITHVADDKGPTPSPTATVLATARTAAVLQTAQQKIVDQIARLKQFAAGEGKGTQIEAAILQTTGTLEAAAIQLDAAIQALASGTNANTDTLPTTAKQ